MASTIWLIFCAVSVGEREGLASFGGGGNVEVQQLEGGEDVASVVGTGVGKAVGVGAVIC